MNYKKRCKKLTCSFLFSFLYFFNNSYAQQPKAWTVIIYMAADNDLRGFAARNIKQMAEIGSTSQLNIVVELHIRISGNQKTTRRYYIEKNKVYHVNANDPASQRMDSGDPKTLISCCTWAVREYPADNYALVLWNHGSGPVDVDSGRIINPTSLFTFNPATNKFDLDRTIGFLDFINMSDTIDRGICWDDSTGNYLSNQKLEAALQEIKSTAFNNNSFNIIGFDACLMASLEIANIVKDYANIMVASQEVELGTGWNYQKVLSIFQHATVTETSFAQHMVKEFGATYNSITNDYTQSAMNLKMIPLLEENLHSVANLLLSCLKQQRGTSVRNAIRASRDRKLCTHFDEPSYLDLHHLYTNIRANLHHFHLTDSAEENTLKAELNKALDDGCSLIKQIAFANISGKNLKRAQGISIYFPERNIHHSYHKTKFAENNQWIQFLKQFLGL